MTKWSSASVFEQNDLIGFQVGIFLSSYPLIILLSQFLQRIYLSTAAWGHALVGWTLLNFMQKSFLVLEKLVDLNHRWTERKAAGLNQVQTTDFSLVTVNHRLPLGSNNSKKKKKKKEEVNSW